MNKQSPNRKKKNRSKSLPKSLLVRPREAWALLGCGHTYGYALIERGELDSFADGSARWITVASIENYIARRLAAPKRTIKKAGAEVLAARRLEATATT